MAVASQYGPTLADVNALRLWEMNHLVAEMDKEATASRRPPGSIPVMT